MDGEAARVLVLVLVLVLGGALGGVWEGGGWRMRRGKGERMG